MISISFMITHSLRVPFSFWSRFDITYSWILTRLIIDLSKTFRIFSTTSFGTQTSSAFISLMCYFTSQVAFCSIFFYDNLFNPFASDGQRKEQLNQRHGSLTPLS